MTNEEQNQKLQQALVIGSLPLDAVNRVEVIDEKGRTYVNWKSENKVELSFQDEGRTLKVFITKGNDR